MPDIDNYRRILAYVSFGPQDAQVIRHASALAKSNGAQLRLLHVVDMETALDGGSGLTPRQEALAYTAVALPRLKAMAASIRGVDVECHVRTGPFASTFKQYTQDWMPELVVTTRLAQDVHVGPWDVFILNAPSQSWLQRLLSWGTSHSEPVTMAPGSAG